MSKPLAGVRVLDLSNIIAGPLCTYQLAQLGAEVIKIERPGTGDLSRKMGADPSMGRKNMGASFLALNAGKRSITLNIQQEQGREIFRMLLTNADVVFENFRPGVMKRLGLDYDSLKKINPGLVYCAVSGFGQDGPLSKRPAYDQIIQGYSGIMSVTGTEETGPFRAGYVVCDTMGAMTAAFAIFTDQGQTGLHDPTGRVFRLTADGKLDCLLDTIPSPNGLVLSRSERAVFVAVTRANAIWLVPMTARGGVNKVGLFVQLPCPGPDGMALDDDGNVAVAHPGLGIVWLFSSRGVPLYRVESCKGNMITNVAYGGDGRRFLYMTESQSGTVLRAEMPTPGRAMYSHS